MTKAALLFFGLAALVALPTALPAQDDSNAGAVNEAVNEAVLRQANTIVLRQKLTDAARANQSGDTAAAAKLYQEACDLVQQIGSGIDTEAVQAVNGLAGTRLALAQADQARGDLLDASVQVQQILRVDPKNPAALAFKKQNDQMLAAQKGQVPSPEAQAQVALVAAQKTDAATLVQNGKLFYEMGKLDEAEAQLNQALALDPDNRAAYYYKSLLQQDKYTRETQQHSVDTSKRMTEVEKHWILPSPTVNLPVPNAYATNSLIYTGPGRQAIVDKLDRIRLDDFRALAGDSGIPLSEVLRNLSEQARLRDPEHKGINFLINPNVDQSGPSMASASGLPGALGMPGGVTIDPNTGLPTTGSANAGGGYNNGGNGGESVDVGGFIVKIPSLMDVRLADVLDAIVLVSDHPVKYSIEDFAVVFSAKGAQTPQLFSRIFKVDPNTFYSGLESVSTETFGAINNGNNNSSGGYGGSSSYGNNNNNNNNSSSGSGGTVVGVVNAFSGEGALRSSLQSSGYGGGQNYGNQNNGNQNYGNQNGQNYGGQTGGAGSGSLSAGISSGGNGGLRYVTTLTPGGSPSLLARQFFTTLGVNLDAPGKSLFFNDRLGKLFVRATSEDLDTIERAIQMMNEVAPQVHIKSRFIEVSQNDNTALGFDWYVGQVNIGNSVVGQGGNPGSLNVPTSSANPIGAFPGATLANTIADGGQQLFSSGLASGNGATTATITGILTNPNFQVVIHALQQRQGYESLAEPEVTTISGRQTQMRATQIINVVTGVYYEQGTPASYGNSGTSTVP